MSQWRATDKTLWRGRDDSAESPKAKRMFQVVNVCDNDHVANSAGTGDIALLGFACDEGVYRNQGRRGAAEAPSAIRSAMASLAAHGSKTWWDCGDVVCNDGHLENAQQQLAELVCQNQQAGLTTLVLGGGHETAYGHGLGVYRAHPDKRVGIINFDAHLDMRSADQATSGTPFLQLAQYCQTEHRPFHYLCLGASLAANTQALIDNAKQHGTRIIWDTDCFDTVKVTRQLTDFIKSIDAIYLTVDLDAIHAAHLFAVSAPAAFGIGLSDIMQYLLAIVETGKVIAGDVVEYNPELDRDRLCAGVAARLIWQMAQIK